MLYYIILYCIYCIILYYIRCCIILYYIVLYLLYYIILDYIILYCIVLYLLYYIILYCFMLYYILLYFIILYYIVLYCIVLYLLYYIILDYVILYYIVLYCIYCIILYYIIWYYVILYYIVLCFTILYWIVLYCIILYYIVLCYTILCYIIFYYTILYYIIYTCRQKDPLYQHVQCLKWWGMPGTWSQGAGQHLNVQNAGNPSTSLNHSMAIPYTHLYHLYPPIFIVCTVWLWIHIYINYSSWTIHQLLRLRRLFFIIPVVSAMVDPKRSLFWLVCHPQNRSDFAWYTCSLVDYIEIYIYIYIYKLMIYPVRVFMIIIAGWWFWWFNYLVLENTGVSLITQLILAD